VRFTGEKNIYSCNCGITYPFFIVRRKDIKALQEYVKQLEVDFGIDCDKLGLKKK